MVRYIGRALWALAGGLILVAAMARGQAVRAQGAGQARLSELQTDQFPRITAFLDVRDEQDRFITGVSARQLTVFENGQPQPVEAFEERTPGVQLVLAINPGPPFAIRDSQGNSRYDYLVEALQSWARAQPDSGTDDLSLLTTTGPQLTHLDDPEAWLTALSGYQPNPRTATPSLDVLARALDVAADPTDRAGMGRAILFLTPPLENATALSLPNLAARAEQAGIRIFVWMVGSANLFDTAGAQSLNELAVSSRGQFFPFSGVEPVPDLDHALDSLRHIYALSYQSQLTESGSHEVQVEVALDETTLTTSAQTFDLEIAPPNPVFVSPPPEIVRTDPTEGRSPDGALVPRTQPLEILVEFPDNHPRPLRATRLFVNGTLVDENTAPPFERFVWDLGESAEGGRHLLRAVAIDSLGLTGSSTEIPVQITIQLPEPGLAQMFSRNGPGLAVAAILMAGAILLLVLILGGRIRPRPIHLPRARRKRQEDPVTQPVRPRVSPSAPTRPRALARWASELPDRLQRPSESAASAPPAHLARLNEDGLPRDNARIPITAMEVTFGSDSEEAMVVLQDPSVEGLHARLRRQPDGTFVLADQGSIAGTWINYAPVSKEWARLEDGDLVHIGRVGFRFHTDNGRSTPRPEITYEEPAA